MMIKRILLTFFLLSVINYNQGALEYVSDISNKLIPAHIRLTNEDSLLPQFDFCDNVVSSFIRKWSIVGASVAIAKEGRLVYARGFGFSDTSSIELTEPFSRFRTASISKLVTATAIMKLIEEGKLSFNDKVFGPDGILNDHGFANPKDRRVFDITIAHLLSHEGGWNQRYGDHMFMPFVITKKMGVNPPADTKTIIRFALEKRLHFPPGTGRSYSNLGYSILGLVIEKVSGMTYEEYCRLNLLEPLGIYDMKLAKNLQDDKAPFEVTYYMPENWPLKPSVYGTGELVPSCYGGNDIEALGGAGAWIATAPDLLRLLLAVDGFNTRKDILSFESIRLMTDEKNGYAPIGWKSSHSDGTWYRTGSFSGSAGMLKRQPDGIVWVVLFNTSTWNGPEIHSYVNRMMSKIISQIPDWPDYDLFSHMLPLPLQMELNPVGIN